ncbi:MAG: hypothetical protein ACFFDW_05125 [Candidatus Thorarchaeota archaeon]
MIEDSKVEMQDKIVKEINPLKSLNQSLWLLFSSFLAIGILYILSGIFRIIDFDIHSIAIILYSQVFQWILAAAGLTLALGLIFFSLNINNTNRIFNLQNFKLPIIVVILSIINLLYYLISSFVVMLILLMLYDGTDYTDLQNKVLAITTPITYILFAVILVLVLVMFAHIGKQVINKKRIIITAIIIIPFALVGIFFNTYLIFGNDISGLNTLFMNLTIDFSQYWLVAIPYAVLFFLLAGMILEIYLYLNKLVKEHVVITNYAQ